MCSDFAFGFEGRLMPRIPDEMLDNLAFMYRTQAEADARVRLGGSAFLVGRPLNGFPNRTVPYLISNRHVVFDASACVASVNCRSGPPDVWDIDQNAWIAHPSADLAAAPLQGFINFERHRISLTPFEHFVTQELAEEAQIGVGDEVFMIGRFVNHQGSDENRPAARFGNISMMIENIEVPDGLGNKRKEESLAVEMRSRTGFSGSPVFLYRTPMSVFIKGVANEHKNLVRLLGVNYGYIKDENGENTFLNGVVPCWKIVELLDQPPLMAHQREVEGAFERHMRSAGDIQPTLAGA